MRSFGGRLRDLRLQADDNQCDLAAACGVKREAVSQWEKGKMMPDHSHVMAIMSRYKVGYKWLVHGTPKRTTITSLEDMRREIMLLRQEVSRLDPRRITTLERSVATLEARCPGLKKKK